MIKFNPIQFIRSERLSNQERYILFNYLPCCLLIENSSVEIDLNLIDIQSIYDNLHLNNFRLDSQSKQGYAYSFFYYNGLFPDDYEYEDMQYEPYFDQIPVYLEAFEYGPMTASHSSKGRQMGAAFSMEGVDEEKYAIKMPGEIDDPVLKLSIKTMKPAS